MSTEESLNMLMVEEGYDYPVEFPAPQRVMVTATPKPAPVALKQPKVVPCKRLNWIQKLWWRHFQWCEKCWLPNHRYYTNCPYAEGYVYVCYKCNGNGLTGVETLEKFNED